MRRLELSRPEVLCAQIAAAARHSPELRWLHRAHCVLMASHGMGCGEVARLFGGSPRSIERWMRAYERAGEEALRDHHGGGRPRRAPPETLTAVAQALASAPRSLDYPDQRWTGRLLQRHLREAFGVALGIRQCQRLMRAVSGDASNVAAGPPVEAPSHPVA
jgi:transposase